MPKCRKPRTSYAAALAVLSLAFGWALPAAAFDAETGLKLARTWCTSCHLVEPGGAAVDAGPPFSQVANDPRLTDDRLRAWLADPHPPMPNLHLGRDEVAALLAYLHSLKTQ